MIIIDEQSEAMHRLESVQTRLWRLVAGFQTTGNPTVAMNLQKMAIALEETQKMCENIFYRHNENAYKQAREGHENILRTALAVTNIR